MARHDRRALRSPAQSGRRLRRHNYLNSLPGQTVRVNRDIGEMSLRNPAGHDTVSALTGRQYVHASCCYYSMYQSNYLW